MSSKISIRGAAQHNLKQIDIDIPLNCITVVTGVSGAGKSSLAFDTLYAEGQRRYIESFSAYARQFMDRMDKPAVASISGILPAVAIGQTNPVKTSRSTLGTLTEITDYMKLLFPRLATLHCRTCGRPVEKDTSGSIARTVLERCAGRPCQITFPFIVPDPTVVAPGEVESGLRRQGFFRMLENGSVVEINAQYLSERPRSPIDILVDRLVPAADNRARLVDSLETALKFGKGLTILWVGVPPQEKIGFSTALHCPACDISYRAPGPALFSFNSPLGACEHCNGFGKTIEVDLDAVIPDRQRSLEDDAVKPWSTPSYREAYHELLAWCRQKGIPVDVPFADLRPPQQQAVIQGDEDFYGIAGFFNWLESRTYKMHIRVLLSKYRTYETCPACQGTRFREETLLYRLNGCTIADIYAMTTAESRRFMDGVRARAGDDKTVAVLTGEICRRLEYLEKVGLGYLTLDRQSRTLSGGEVERASLTTALGSSLVNTLYVLDEPSIGLHPRDTHLLIDVLKRLRSIGNTIVLVEHDPDIIRHSDHIIDLGPRSGDDGGTVTFAGPPRDLTRSPDSLTGGYLSGRSAIPVPAVRRPPDRRARIVLRGASTRNLRNLHASIPLRQLVCITGVSGSGKSTLLEDVLDRHLSRATAQPSEVCFFQGTGVPEHVVRMDQSPIGKTPRSNPATYLKVFDLIRQVFAQTERARDRGYTASTFSFNSSGGRCELCRGEGFEKVEMQFLADIYVTCPACGGSRYTSEVLDVRYQGKNIREVLDLTIAEAREFFSETPKIEYPLRLLDMVGLGYLRLGQPANTLSGGESQRLKIASFIRQGSSGTTLFLFDEPTTGLHFDDIQALLQTFHFLISHGHTVIVVEHNMEIIKCADHVIDLGPEGGAGGGTIVFSGTPEDLVREPASHTGRFLQPFLAAGPIEIPPGTTAPEAEPAGPQPDIDVQGAREHNLQNVTLRIPRERVVVITGPSGSGKSSLAFDILYAEGQRRFLETLSPYARQYVTQLTRPDVDAVRGLPPTVAIEQLLSRGGKKSTVATVTEIYHYLRLLYAKIGVQHCPECGQRLSAQTPEHIAAGLRDDFGTQPVMLLAPQVRGRKGFHRDIIQRAKKDGYEKIRIDGTILNLQTIFAVRRYHEHKLELVTAEFTPAAITDARLQDEVNRTLGLGAGELIVLSPDGTEKFYSTRACCPECHISLEEPDPRLFSFNSSQGACQVCEGLGTSSVLSPDLLVVDREQSLRDGAVPPLTAPVLGANVRRRLLEQIETDLKVPLDLPLKKFSPARLRRLLHGTASAPGLAERLQAPALQKKSGWDDYLAQFFTEAPCPACNGTRLNKAARSVQINGKSIGALCALTAPQLIEELNTLELDERQSRIARPILQELIPKIELLGRAGLSYLSLDRGAHTLSGGESQRIRLAAQVASNLRGVAYVLDEPTIGLHPHDNRNMIAIIRDLQQKGNSVIIVEHDEDTIRQADHIVDLGPGGGTQGGTVVAAGTLQDIMRATGSLTGAYLAGRHATPAHQPRTLQGCRCICVEGAAGHNLRDITARFPLGRLTVVTGVSGSGKTTLVRETLYRGLKKMLGQYHGTVAPHCAISGARHIRRVVEIDQSPIGKTPRSTPATYVGLYDAVRQLYAQVPEARLRGYTAARFSFNLRGGRCEKCAGQGKLKVAMSFLPDIYMDCDICRGTRFNDETLQILFKSRSIADVLEMTVEEGCRFFADIPTIAAPLQVLDRLGLGYLTLGQASPTLSGGEAQRIKIAAELSRNGRGTTLYVLDEPTTGLHPADIGKLMQVLQELVDLGNTIVIIEHNLDVIEQADTLIDLGPGGGEAGGSIVAEGPPADVAAADGGESLTARYLHRHMQRTSSAVA